MEVKPSTFGFQWHDSLMPIGPNYTALERAIFECACAGCESIWITVNDDWAPLIKHRIGDYVQDPVWYYREYDVFGSDSRKVIPIFCVPHVPKYRSRRDSLGWGIINAALYALRVTKNISEFLYPNRFYAAFPFGVYDPRALIKERNIISSSKQFYVTHKGRTVKDNKRLGFTFTREDIKKINANISSKNTGTWEAIGDFVKDDPSAWSKRRPLDEQYIARKFTLDKVFEPMGISDAEKLELPWYYDISTWEGYKKYMGSTEQLKRPKPLTAGKLPAIGVDDD
jgi:hypothetical protein